MPIKNYLPVGVKASPKKWFLLRDSVVAPIMEKLIVVSLRVSEILVNEYKRRANPG